MPIFVSHFDIFGARFGKKASAGHLAMPAFNSTAYQSSAPLPPVMLCKENAGVLSRNARTAPKQAPFCGPRKGHRKATTTQSTPTPKAHLGPHHAAGPARLWMCKLILEIAIPALRLQVKNQTPSYNESGDVFSNPIPQSRFSRNLPKQKSCTLRKKTRNWKLEARTLGTLIEFQRFSHNLPTKKNANPNRTTYKRFAIQRGDPWGPQ